MLEEPSSSTGPGARTVAANSATEPPAWKRIAKWGLLGGLVTATISAASAISMWDDSDGLQRRVCVDWPWSSDWVQSRDDICKAKYRTIDVDEAAQTIDEFLYAAAFGNLDEVSAMLGTRYQNPDSKRDFLDRWWEPTTFAERTHDVVAQEDFNTFDTKVRFYAVTRPDGWLDRRQIVDEHTLPVQLERTEDGNIILTRIFPVETISGRVYDMPLISFTTNTEARVFPSPESGPTAFTDVKEGSQLRGLCYLPSGDTYWMQTYGGWFPASEFEVIEAPEDGQLIKCSEYTPARRP